MSVEGSREQLFGGERPAYDTKDIPEPEEGIEGPRNFTARIGDTEVLVGRPRGDAGQPYELYLPQVIPDEIDLDDDEDGPEKIYEQTISFRGGEAVARQVFNKVSEKIRDMDAARKNGEEVSVNDVYRAMQKFIDGLHIDEDEGTHEAVGNQQEDIPEPEEGIEGPRNFTARIGDTEVLVGRPRGDAGQPYELYLPQVIPDEIDLDDDEDGPEKIYEQTISFRGGEAVARQVFNKVSEKIRDMDAARKNGEEVSVNDVYRAMQKFIDGLQEERSAT